MNRTRVISALLDWKFETYVTRQVLSQIYRVALWTIGALVILVEIFVALLVSTQLLDWVWLFALPATPLVALVVVIALRLTFESSIAQVDQVNDR